MKTFAKIRRRSSCALKCHGQPLVNLMGNPFWCNLDARKFYQSILINLFRFSLPLASLIDGIELGSQFLTYFTLKHERFHAVRKVRDLEKRKSARGLQSLLAGEERRALRRKWWRPARKLHQFRKLGLWEEWVCLAFFSSRLRSQSFSFKT